MMECSKCGKELGMLPFTCRYCGKQFCKDHQLPENHGCEGLEKWKRGELKEFKKEVKSRHYTSSEILYGHPYDQTEVPSWIKRGIRRIKNSASNFMSSVKRVLRLK